MFILGKLTSSDIDDRVCEQLRSFPDDLISIESLFNEFNNSDLTGVVNKSAFLCNLIKQWKIQNPQQERFVNNDSQSTQSSTDLMENNSGKHKPGPDEIKLKVKISKKKTNFSFLTKTKSYRKFSIEQDIKWILLLVNVNTVAHHLMVLNDQLQIAK